MLRAILCLFVFCIQTSAFADEKISIEDRTISLTFKTLAKAFVSMADIEKLKKSNISKIEKMDDGKFKKRYGKIYGALRELPLSIKTTYGIKEDMSKKEILQKIEPLDKKELYRIINAIPDETIARIFKNYLKERKRQINKTELVKQINNFWFKMIKKADKP